MDHKALEFFSDAIMTDSQTNEMDRLSHKVLTSTSGNIKGTLNKVADVAIPDTMSMIIGQMVP